VFHRLKLIEAYGTGIPRIFETYAKFGVVPEIPITNVENENGEDLVIEPLVRIVSRIAEFDAE